MCCEQQIPKAKSKDQALVLVLMPKNASSGESF
jgi:hypothetical protein